MQKDIFRNKLTIAYLSDNKELIKRIEMLFDESQKENNNEKAKTVAYSSV